MLTPDDIRELKSVFRARHGRETTLGAKQFYSGAWFAMQIVEVLMQGDRSRLHGIRRAEILFQENPIRPKKGKK